MFRFSYETRYGDYRDFDTLKPGALLDIIQDISIKDSNRCGYGIHKLRDMNMAWLMQGINVKFEKLVKTITPLEVYTAVKSLKGATSERGCIIKQDGEIVAKSIANWFLFDTEKLRITKVLEDMIDSYEYYNFDDSFQFQRLRVLEIEAFEYTVRVSNKDIDTNRHLNNQKSAELLMDALPFEFYFNKINILYKRPAYLGDELEVCIKEIENGYYVHLQTREKEVCVAGQFEYN